MRKRLILISAIATILFNSCANSTKNVSTKKEHPLVLSSEADKYNQQMLSYINTIRIQGTSCAKPTSPLVYNYSLDQAAKAHARDMAVNGFLGHTGSGTSYDLAKTALGKGSTFTDRLAYFGYPQNTNFLVGENVTKVSIKTTKTTDIMPNFKKAMEKIINHKTHCVILMNPRFNDIGIGMVRRGEDYYFVMDLGQSR